MKFLCYSGFDHRVAEVQQILPDRIGLFLTEVQMISNEMSVVTITHLLSLYDCCSQQLIDLLIYKTKLREQVPPKVASKM